jgi:hypothetical protein
MTRRKKKSFKWERVDQCRKCGKSMRIVDEETGAKRTKRYYWCPRCDIYAYHFYDTKLVYCGQIY